MENIIVRKISTHKITEFFVHLSIFWLADMTPQSSSIKSQCFDLAVMPLVERHISKTYFQLNLLMTGFSSVETSTELTTLAVV